MANKIEREMKGIRIIRIIRKKDRAKKRRKNKEMFAGENGGKTENY